MNLFAISTVRNEADIIDLNVRYHLRQGVDRFLIIDNGSTDGTTQRLARLARDPRVRWSRDAGDWHQAEAQTELARAAARAGADWVMSVDADEFWAPSGAASSLKEALAACQGEAAEVEIVNFVQDRRQRELRPGLLLSMVYRVATPIGPAQDCERLVESREIAFVEMQYPPKMIARAHESLSFSSGAHTIPGLPPDAVRRSDRIVCLHAPLRARQILESKAEQGHRCEIAGRPPGEAWHVRRWFRLSGQAGQMDSEWNANSQMGGMLSLDGRDRALVRDLRLREAVRPFCGLRSVPSRLSLSLARRPSDVTAGSPESSPIPPGP